MKILVTGASGFIGRHLCNYLENVQHHKVTRLDVIPSPGYEYGSVLSPDHGQYRGQGLVIHLASVMGVKVTESKPRHTLDVILQGTRGVIDACNAVGVPRLIYASSSEVYGESDQSPIREDDPIKPKSVYGKAKAAAEEYVKASTMAWTIARPFNVYGPGQRTDFVVARFIQQALAGEKLTIYGKGYQSRCYCHITDAVKGFAAMIGRPSSHREIFNIGDGTGFAQVNTLAEVILEAAGRDPKDIEYIPFHASDRSEKREINDRRPSTVKALRLLDWMPSIRWRDGISNMIQAELRGKVAATQ